MNLWQTINKVLLISALHKRKAVTLDIDTTEVVANKTCAKWTYKSNKGYMPMVGHIAETGQVVACDFRKGNESPNSRNLEFIRQCQDALPDGCKFQSLRIDSAGYQEAIIRYCDTASIHYVIRAKMCATIREQIEALTETEWHPLRNRKGEVMMGQDTYCTVHCIGDHEKPFTLILQRKRMKGQVGLELEISGACEEITAKGYIYRAIATDRDDLSNSEIVHWYDQRGEDRENRI